MSADRDTNTDVLRAVEATALQLPKFEGVKKSITDQKWKAAFDWYNKYVNTSKKPIEMNCTPCYGKVLHALVFAKQETTKDDE